MSKLKLFREIARVHLNVETLQEQGCDRLDFHDVSVEGIKRALNAAYDAGREDGVLEKTRACLPRRKR